MGGGGVGNGAPGSVFPPALSGVHIQLRGSIEAGDVRRHGALRLRQTALLLK